jgi:hypothetical protein
MRAALVRGAPVSREAGALCLICLVWLVETVSVGWDAVHAIRYVIAY